MKNNSLTDEIIKKYDIRDWQQIVSGDDVSNLNANELKRNLAQGIPECLRGDMWALISKANRYLERSDQFTYLRLFSQDDIGNETQIKKDIHRTFPEHIMFKSEESYGQKGLLNILKAYSQFDTEIGYCQGMGFIAGILLMHMHSEELAFWAFVGVMDNKNWRRIYEVHTPKLFELLAVLTDDIKIILPRVYQHLQNYEFEFSIFARYFLTICSYKVPLKLAVRIMDVFLLEGEDKLIKIIIKLLYLKQLKILTLKREKLFGFLSENLVNECVDEFGISRILSEIEQEIQPKN